MNSNRLELGVGLQCMIEMNSQTEEMKWVCL